MGNAPGEIRCSVLPERHPASGLSPDTVYVSGIYVPAATCPRPQWQRLDGFPACGECGGDTADEQSNPRVEAPETNLCRPERAGQALQCHTARMVELLRPLLQVRDATSL